jgi:hypothetical protein
MNPPLDNLYDKIEQVSKTVRDSFRRRGVVIPAKGANGSIVLGSYSIERLDDGFYVVFDHRKDKIADRINLPQTAALVANDLALGRMLNSVVLEADRQYGYARFEENLYAKRIQNSKDLDRFELAMIKCTVVKNRREYYQNSIMQRFEKLRKLV